MPKLTDEELAQVAEVELTAAEAAKIAALSDVNNPQVLQMGIDLLRLSWATFHLYVITPNLPILSPPEMIYPETLPNSSEQEFVYPIQDAGSRLSTSKAEDMPSSGMSMCKLFYTMEKMFNLLVDKLKSAGVTSTQEVQVAFGGNLEAQRKAFEMIINCTDLNIVVTNFDPELWGENYLQTVKRMADKGYGYPAETPRSVYKQSHGSVTSGIKRGG